jgi:hypothetical protein
MVHMYIVTNTTIFLTVRLLLLRYNYMFRASMWAIFRLLMTYLKISYIYMWVGSLQFVGWGGCEISFCVCRRGMDRVCLGGFVKISFMSTNSYVYKLVTFLYVPSYIGKAILSWTTSKMLWSSTVIPNRGSALPWGTARCRNNKYFIVEIFWGE